MRRNKYNCHMKEMAGPHHHAWSHHGPVWVLCWSQCNVPDLQGQGRCAHAPVVWLCSFSPLPAKQLGRGDGGSKGRRG